MNIPSASSRGYQIIEEIGSGGFGVVYRANQKTVDRDVAIKVILPEIARDEIFIKRFEQEARLAARLEHPNIVPLYDYWQDENGAYLAMRWLRGGNLKESLADGPWDIEAALRLVEQLAGALDAAHSQGVIHRDLKPSNILLDDRGNAYLADFGIAKHLVGTTIGTPTGSMIGSPAYMSPEQITGSKVTTLSDIYSFGMVIFEILAGYPPFKELEPASLLYKQVHEPVPLLSEQATSLPPEIDTVLQKATMKDPFRRFSSAESLSAAFHKAAKPGYQAPPDLQSEELAAGFPQIPSFLEEAIPLSKKPTCVGRDKEMELLNGFLNSALEGKGSVVFVAGDIGSGKTTLLDAFAWEALAAEPDLLIAQGSSNAFSGPGDPYLPFRDALRMLSGDIESHLSSGTISRERALSLWEGTPITAEALVAQGPDLIGTFVPGSGLVLRTSMFFPAASKELARLRQASLPERHERNHLEQLQLFEQYLEVLRVVSSRRPVLLLIDDLQWSDSGTANMLFHLGRRLSGSRVLLVCAYRPEELLSAHGEGRHPLQSVLEEFKSWYGDIRIDLNQSDGRLFIDMYLDTEPNELDHFFREKLFEHTGGHALFTTELLRNMQERGELFQNPDNRWVEKMSLDWMTLPTRVEGVIEARIGRLEASDRDILSVASVEGVFFTVQVLSEIQKLDERDLLIKLSRNLEKHHRLVHEYRGKQIGPRYISLFAFSHGLYQLYLYNQLGEGERRLLHGEVAARLEEIYAGNPEEVVIQLARHYTLSGQGHKAKKYLLEAGDKARLQHTYMEAIEYYKQALSFLEKESDHERIAKVLMKLGHTYHSAYMFREAREAYAQGLPLLQRDIITLPDVRMSSHPLRPDFGEPPSLDPAMASDSESELIAHQLFAGLVEQSTEMGVVPDLSVSWEVLDSGRRYIFRLRRDASWSDGSPVTAEDFEYAWKRLLHPGTESPVAQLLFDIKGAMEFHDGVNQDPAQVGVRALDGLTLEVELESPAGYFLNLLSHPAAFVVPSKTVEMYGKAWTLSENIVTCGPFMMQERDLGESMVLVRNPHYHGQRAGNVQRMECRPRVEEAHFLLSEYEEDRLDFINLAPLPAAEKDRTSRRHVDEYVVLPTQYVDYLIFNTRHGPFKDVRVRQAIAMAVDQEALVDEALHGYDLPAAGGVIPPGIPGHSGAIGFTHNPDRARELLSDSGYPAGEGFPAITSNAWSRVKTVTDYVTDSLSTILGIDVRWTVVDWEVYTDLLSEYSFPITYQSWYPDYPDPDNYLRTSGLARYAWLEHDELNLLLENARRNPDQAQRMALYRRADELLVQEAIVLPLTYRQYHGLIKPWIRGYPGKWKNIVIEPHDES